MRTDTYILSLVMKQLAEDIICEDGIATAAILEAADRLVELQGDNTHLISQNNKLKSEITKLQLYESKSNSDTNSFKHSQN